MRSADAGAPGTRLAGLGLLVVLLLAPVLAAGQEAGFEFRVTVLHASESGPVAPEAQRFDRLLRRRVRYQGLRVLQGRTLRVATNDIGRVRLPDGTVFRFRPIDPTGPGALVAIDMGRTQGDFRLPAHKPLILGGAPWKGGQLVVVLELGG